ncbi:Fructosamine kinase-domain-containing protein [Pavlovales sp. CCMP2436]|nr:Fructosamine kinase-domain-containing protein [Pavlovales sp. CCMP2436]
MRVSSFHRASTASAARTVSTALLLLLGALLIAASIPSTDAAALTRSSLSHGRASARMSQSASLARPRAAHGRASARMSAATDWLTANGWTLGKEQGGGGSDWASFSSSSVTAPDGTSRRLFIKAARRPAQEMFAGEALGLRALRAGGALRVPEVIHYGDASGGGSFLIMEHLELRGSANPAEFGRAMAQLHLAEPSSEPARAGKFGFDVENTIGGTSQPNGWLDDWPEFFRTRRIGHQIRLTGSDELATLWDTVLDRTSGLGALFEGVEVKPSVLHGDLWSGNMAATANEPCIFDPATYFGHHEAEWGMSWCASLGPAFWSGYRELIREDPGFAERRNLYELYHKLNHYNMFGGGYYGDSVRLMTRLAGK